MQSQTTTLRTSSPSICISLAPSVHKMIIIVSSAIPFQSAYLISIFLLLDLKLVLCQCGQPCDKESSCTEDTGPCDRVDSGCSRQPCASPCSSCQEPTNYVTNACDLECDFDKPCHWHNGTNCVEDDIDWPIATSVPLDSWHSIPRGVNGPEDPFAYSQGSVGIHTDLRGELVSDPIRCQIGNGKLKFWFWKTALHPSLRVCIRKPPGDCGKLTCLHTIHGLHRHEWVMRMVHVPHQNDPFQIVLQSKVKHNFDIIGLDKISYTARLCETAQPTVSSGPTSATLSSSGTIGTVTEPTVTEQTVSTPEPVPITEATQSSPTTTVPTQSTPAPSPVATPGPIVLTPPVVYSGPSAVQQAGPVYGQAPQQQPGLVYGAPQQQPGPTYGQAPQQPLGYSSGQACPAVDCSFDRGTPCSYVSNANHGYAAYLPPGAVMRQWAVTNRATSNSLTGIFSDTSGTGMYAYAGETNNNLDMFLMDSPRFTVNSPSLVDFNYYLAGVQGRLRGCVNGLTDCRFESTGKDIKSDARRWRRGSFQLDPGAYTVHFVGDNLGKNYVIGLDNVKLRDHNGALVQCGVS